jgi:hypothetical protein
MDYGIALFEVWSARADHVQVLSRLVQLHRMIVSIPKLVPKPILWIHFALECKEFFSTRIRLMKLRF